MNIIDINTTDDGGARQVKTYATRENLTKALERLNLDNEADLRCLVANTVDGRFTAVFMGQGALRCQLWRRGYLCV